MELYKTLEQHNRGRGDGNIVLRSHTDHAEISYGHLYADGGVEHVSITFPQKSYEQRAGQFFEHYGGDQGLELTFHHANSTVRVNNHPLGGLWPGAFVFSNGVFPARLAPLLAQIGIESDISGNRLKIPRLQKKVSFDTTQLAETFYAMSAYRFAPEMHCRNAKTSASVTNYDNGDLFRVGARFVSAEQVDELAAQLAKDFDLRLEDIVRVR